MRKLSLVIVAAVLAAYCAPSLSSVANAQTLPAVFQQTVDVQLGQSATLTIPLTAGVDYYFTAARNVGTGYYMPGDAMLYLFSPTGAQLMFNDDWGINQSSWNTTLLGPFPTNGYSAFFKYTATVSGNHTMRVVPYGWNVRYEPFPVVVYGTSAAAQPTPGGTGIPNVLHTPRPKGFDGYRSMVASLNVETRYPVLMDVQQHPRWIVCPSKTNSIA